MSDETETPETENEAEETAGSGRREFLAAAVVGVAGAAALAGSANEAAADTRPAPRVAPKLTAAEQVKENKRVQAETLLKELDNVEIVWVKGTRPANRKIIQLVG